MSYIRGGMAETLRATGVRLFLMEELSESDREVGEAGRQGTEVVHIGWEAFADVEDSGRRYRVTGGREEGWPVELTPDPTSQLLEAAEKARQLRGDLLGDLRISGADLSRWDFYAAPFRIELSDRLRERLMPTGKTGSPKKTG